MDNLIKVVELLPVGFFNTSDKKSRALMLFFYFLEGAWPLGRNCCTPYHSELQGCGRYQGTAGKTNLGLTSLKT
jgi:hypothetical protein